jgi:hypothetical protein
MRPAQRAVAGVDPQFTNGGAADVGDIGGCGGTQAAPQIGLAALRGVAGIGHTRQHQLDAVQQHLAAGLGQARSQRQVVAAYFNRARYPQLVA